MTYISSIFLSWRIFCHLWFNKVLRLLESISSYRNTIA